jgi:hypothetical protein
MDAQPWRTCTIDPWNFHAAPVSPRQNGQCICRYASERIGLGYGLKNIIDLMRYLFPWPVPQRWRGRMIALGSGDASRIICSLANCGGLLVGKKNLDVAALGRCSHFGLLARYTAPLAICTTGRSAAFSPLRIRAG